jgi:hypothetical protein
VEITARDFVRQLCDLKSAINCRLAPDNGATKQKSFATSRRTRKMTNDNPKFAKNSDGDDAPSFMNQNIACFRLLNLEMPVYSSPE